MFYLCTRDAPLMQDQTTRSFLPPRLGRPASYAQYSLHFKNDHHRP